MSLEKLVDHYFAGDTPSHIIAKTTCALLAANIIVSVLKDGDILSRLNAAKWSAVRKVFSRIVRSKVAEAADAIKFPVIANEPIITRLPADGMSKGEILKVASFLHNGMDLDYRKGTCSGYVYHGGEEHTAFMNEVMSLFQWSNPLHVDVCGAVRKMEAEIVSMVLSMYNGDARPGSCGALTSGGTESIGMAVKSYREWGITRGITTPTIVAPITAHPAFDKACSYYQVRLIHVPVGPSGAVDAKELEKYIRHDTVAIVGSAPTFPHGTFDPIGELSEIAFSRGIGLHVDCCLGSFIVPFLAKAGFPSAVVDFRNRGVTSISCDTHKYGFSPKGTSVVMYATEELRSFQFFTYSGWPGGMYCSPGASGSKAGNVIAATWAALINTGESGYVDSCRKIVSTRVKITDALGNLPFFYVMGQPCASVFAFGSDDIDIYILSDRMKAKGWGLNPLQFPAGLQFSLTLLQTKDGVADRFLQDICEIGGELYAQVLKERAEGKVIAIGSNGATLYGSQQRIADRTIINEVMKVYLQGYYGTDHSLTTRGKTVEYSQ